jgi:hypothetical protein
MARLRSVNKRQRRKMYRTKRKCGRTFRMGRCPMELSWIQWRDPDGNIVPQERPFRGYRYYGNR